MKQLLPAHKLMPLIATVLIALNAGSALAYTQFGLKNSVLQASEVSGVAKKPKKEKKSKAKGSSGVTFYEGSAESRVERDRRLSRECRGRPNSGACEGYARP